jgi:hypothetical protein
MNSENKRIIEINGVKLEVDMRYAKRVDELRVGSKVKVRNKEYSSYKVYPGVIVGFEEFDKLPTIVVAYLDSSWSSADIKFVHYNAESKDVEICAAVTDEADLNKQDAIASFDREIMKKERELADLREKRNYFDRRFGIYWTPVSMPEKEVV